MKWINLNLDDHIHRRLRIACAEAGLTGRAYIRLAIIEKLKRERERREMQEQERREMQSGDVVGR